MFTPFPSKLILKLSSSGLEIADLPPPAEKKTPKPIKEVPTPATAKAAVEVKVDEEKEEEKPVTRSAPPTAVVEPPTSPTRKYAAPLEKTSNNFIVMGAIFAIVLHLVMKTNLHFTSPLGPGLVWENGRERGACGLLSLSPFSGCESAIAKMEDGVFSVTKGDEVVFAISGPACGDVNGNANAKAEDCVDGLVIGEDGKITIGGKKRVKVLTRAQIDIKPWPFSEDVVLPRNML